MIGELTNHVWQSTLFAAAAGLLAVAFRKNRATVRYWLWLSASLKFFVPFALLLSLGRQLEWTPPARIPAQSISIAVQQIAQPFSETLPREPLTSNSRNRLPAAILAVWACGFCVVTLIRLRDWRRIRAAVRASVPVPTNLLWGRLLTCGGLAIRLPRPVNIEVRSSPGLLEPGVVGWWRPILLVPAGIADRLTPPQLQAVLAHELCHVRRCDNLFAGIHMLVEAIFWFHPLVWWIGARLVEERERACDESVLSLCGEPRIYADAILNVCKLYVESPLVCVSGVTGANLKRRIEAIMTNRVGQELNRARKLLLAGAGALTSAAAKFSSIETAARLLAVLPGKKGLMYFAGGVALSGAEYQAELRHAIDLLQKSDVAIYSIDVREVK